MNILVTGGHGMLGSALQKIVKNNQNNTYYFISSSDCDLRDEVETERLFHIIKPDIVIHLASRVGGVYKNMNNNYKFLNDNIKIHLNVLNCCDKYNVKFLINILSTCIFPNDNVTYPLTSDQLHDGLPHESNIGYAYSKRILHLASSLLQKKQDKDSFKVVNITPTNLYGDHDNYNLKASHVIPGLIHKVYTAKKNNTPLEVYGTGSAIRQFLYVDDLALVIHKFINMFIHDLLKENEISVIVSPPEKDEISISKLINLICNIFNFDTTNIIYNTSYSDGQYKKTTNDDEIKKYIKDITFTPLKDGLFNTIKYFTENYDNNIVRK